jgi:hypothetical protein
MTLCSIYQEQKVAPWQPSSEIVSERFSQPLVPTPSIYGVLEYVMFLCSILHHTDLSSLSNIHDALCIAKCLAVQSQAKRSVCPRRRRERAHSMES